MVRVKRFSSRRKSTNLFLSFFKTFSSVCNAEILLDAVCYERVGPRVGAKRKTKLTQKTTKTHTVLLAHLFSHRRVGAKRTEKETQRNNKQKHAHSAACAFVFAPPRRREKNGKRDTKKQTTKIRTRSRLRICFRTAASARK